MDEVQCGKRSCAAYHTYVTRTLKKLDEILEREDPLSNHDIAHVEQLTQKKTVLGQLNSL